MAASRQGKALARLPKRKGASYGTLAASQQADAQAPERVDLAWHGAVGGIATTELPDVVQPEGKDPPIGRHHDGEFLTAACHRAVRAAE